MKVVLSNVENVFQIEGRGVVITPGIPDGCRLRVLPGDPIELIPPEGVSLQATIAGIEMINRRSIDSANDTPLLLRSLKKQDVPVGTTVVVLNPRVANEDE